MLLLSKLNYRGGVTDILLRAKFTNDWNFFVREVGRGSGMEERSLVIGEVLRGGGRRWWSQEAGLHTFWEKVRESLSRLSDILMRIFIIFGSGTDPILLLILFFFFLMFLVLGWRPSKKPEAPSFQSVNQSKQIVGKSSTGLSGWG